MKSPRALCLALVAALLCLGAAQPDPREAKLKAGMQLAPDTKMRYLDEAGRAIGFDAFFAVVSKGGAFNIEHDATSATLRLGAKRPDIAAAKAEPRVLRAGDAFPSFDLRNTAGQRVTAASLRGKPVLLNFFFADCTPCIAEIPVLNGYARKHPGARVFGVTFDEAPVAKHFVAQRKFAWPVLADAQSLITDAGVRGFPTFVLLGADGRVLGVTESAKLWGGNNQLDEAELAAWVDRSSKK